MYSPARDVRSTKTYFGAGRKLRYHSLVGQYALRAGGVAMFVLGGCAQLFGIENTSAPVPVVADASIDAPQGCGDGIITGNEPCNGSNLGSATCASAVEQGWVGTLTCTATCTLDTSACAPPQTTWQDMTL